MVLKAPIAAVEGTSNATVSSFSDSSMSQSSHTDLQDCDKLWCYCRQVEGTRQMIGCDHKQCIIGWFHTDCLRITRIPKGKWYCPDCRKKMKRGSKSKAGHN